MIAIPHGVSSEDEFDLILVFGDDGMERLRAADPGIIDIQKLADPWGSKRVRHVTFAYEGQENMAKIMGWMRDGDYVSAIKLLHRGWTVRDEDDDAPYLDLARKPS